MDSVRFKARRCACSFLVALLVPTLWSCSTHPAVQGATAGAVGCGALGGMASGRKAAGQAAAACAVVGALAGMALDSNRASVQARETEAKARLVEMRRATQEIEAYNGQLRRELAELNQLAAQYRSRRVLVSTQQAAVRDRILTAQVRARENLREINHRASHTRHEMDRLRPDDPHYRETYREMQAHLAALDTAEASLRRILGVQL